MIKNYEIRYSICKLIVFYLTLKILLHIFCHLPLSYQTVHLIILCFPIVVEL